MQQQQQNACNSESEIAASSHMALGIRAIDGVEEVTNTSLVEIPFS